MTTSIIPLGELPVGKSARVVRFLARQGSRRFLELGLVPGERVTTVRIAPLGDPLEFAVMGSRVAIRKSDADGILVQEETV
ncbi:MAG: FeoA family protein [Actinomycetota bacterium]